MVAKTNLVDVHAVAAALDCSERQIQNFGTLGMPRIKHGVYDLPACIQWAARYRKRRRFGSVGRHLRRAAASRAFVRMVRRHVQALPAAVAQQLVGKDEAEIRRLLRLAVREALGNLKGGN